MQDLLRNELRYRNLVVSDDLDMKALRKHYSQDAIAVRAMEAGVDILLYCNDFDSPVIALEALKKAVTDKKLNAADLDRSFKMIQQLKKQKIKNLDPMDFTEVSRRVGHPDHLTLARAIAAGHIPKELSAT